MGTVVKLDSSARGRAKSRRRESRTALVLGGGGFTGGVYEIGALRALDLLSVNRSVNQFDIYVGTSAGSLIAALAANGVTPEQMMRVVNNQVPTPFREHQPRHAAAAELPRVRCSAAIKLPLHARSAWRARSAATSARSRRSTWRSRSPTRCPPGLYTGSGIEEYVRTVLSGPGPHRRLPPARERALPRRDRPRHVRADRARRRGLGRRPDLAAPCAASTALPMVYKPHRGQGPRAGRRRHRLDHEPRHRGRGGREVHRRRQPARAVRQRLLEGDPDAVRHARPPGLGHGLPEDRLPDVQAARLPAPARDGRAAGRSATRASTSS